MTRQNQIVAETNFVVGAAPLGGFKAPPVTEGLIVSALILANISTVLAIITEWAAPGQPSLRGFPSGGMPSALSMPVSGHEKLTIVLMSSQAEESRSPSSRCLFATTVRRISRLGLICLGLSGSMGLVTGQAQPANDDYADRITVTGTSVTVTGNLAGATFELPHEPESHINYGWQANASLWWSWIPAESTPVVLWAHRLGSSESTVSGEVLVWTNLCPASTISNWYTCPGYGYACTAVSPNLLPFGAMAFLAQAGSEHAVQLKGARDTVYMVQWVATSAPVILQQPASRIVSPGRSTLFKVMAMGIPPLRYQWRHNGADLPGETAPMLALNNLTPDNAGDYRVQVSSSTGSIESEGAQLAVISLSDLVQLAVDTPTSSDRFAFQLCAEPTRSYRFESSTNLVTWFPQASFPIGQTNKSSVVISTNASQGLTIPRTKPQLFIRASEYKAPNEECINGLKQIQFAKDMWILEKNRFATDTSMDWDLYPYFKNNVKPRCPEGGAYLNNLNLKLPSCKITNHVLEEPRFP